MIGGSYAYTLSAKTCDAQYSTTTDIITFSFCKGGTHCTPVEEVTLTEDDGLDTNDHVIDIPVSIGYEPTTVVVSNTGNNAWCLTELSWEGGDNLLGDSAEMWFDSQFGVELGCNGGLIAEGSTAVCQESWKFFNINGADDYMYDLRVKACEGTKSSTIEAAFCSTADCEIGEIVYVTLAMNDEDGGLTTYEVDIPFNPESMKLFEAENDWCVEKMVFNGFSIIDGNTSIEDFDTDGTMVIPNIQYNGISVTPSPTIAPTPSPIMSSTQAPTQLPSSTTSMASNIGAGVIVFVLFAVLVITLIGLKRHCKAANKNIIDSIEELCAKGSFWSAMVMLLGLLVTISVLSYGIMWRLVFILTGFVLWVLVLVWFVAFETGTRATVSLKAFCSCRAFCTFRSSGIKEDEFPQSSISIVDGHDIES